MGRTQLSPCIYNFSTRTIRASRNAMSAWYFFHAEPLISRFCLEIYITLLQQLWQTVLAWNLYPIFILLNQLAVKITPVESFLWMHLHQFQYLCFLTATRAIIWWLQYQWGSPEVDHTNPQITYNYNQRELLITDLQYLECYSCSINLKVHLIYFLQANT